MLGLALTGLCLTAAGVACSQKNDSAPASPPSSTGNPPVLEPVRSEPSSPPAAYDAEASEESMPTREYGEPVPAEPVPDMDARTHVVQRGDTLWSIAAKYYGNGRQWQRIYKANQNRIKDPKDLPVGIKLIIP